MSKKENIEEKRYIEMRGAMTEDELQDEQRRIEWLSTIEESKFKYQKEVTRDRREILVGQKWGGDNLEKFEDLIDKFSSFHHKEELLSKIVPFIHESLETQPRLRISQEKILEAARIALEAYVNKMRTPYLVDYWTKIKLGEVYLDEYGQMYQTEFRVQTKEMPRRYVDYAEKNTEEVARELGFFVNNIWREAPIQVKNIFNKIEMFSYDYYVSL